MNKVILIQQLNNRYQFITSSDNSIETKSFGLAGLEFTIIVFFISEKFPKIYEHHKVIEAKLGLIFLIVSILLNLAFVLSSRKYASGVVGRHQISEYLKLPESEFLNNVIIDIQQSIEINSGILKSKVKWFKLSLLLLIFGICLITLSSMQAILI